MKKKWLVLAMTMVMAVSSVGCSKSDNKVEKGNKVGGSLIVGQITDLTGDFANGWANGSADADVKYLIAGYQTVTYTKEGTYEVDPTVVKNLDVKENEDGSKTFTFTLNENLEYSNGLKIKAEDYVFSALIGSSPEFEALGAYATTGQPFVGYDEFYNGETKTFTGVRLLGDYEFSVTVKADELPNFYEMAKVSLSPTPMSVYAPGVTLTDEGNGATLSDNFTT